jgi:hypothetical protein
MRELVNCSRSQESGAVLDTLGMEGESHLMVP